MSCLFHKWDRCKCIKCGKIKSKSELHYFEVVKVDDVYCVEKCKVCGASGNKYYHNYERVPNKCQNICVRCGSISDNFPPESSIHNYQKIPGKCDEKCTFCGIIKKEKKHHQWIGLSPDCRSKCVVCGIIDKQILTHQWLELPDCTKKCNVCGCVHWNHDYERISSSEVQGGWISNYRCTKCGHEYKEDTGSCPDSQEGDIAMYEKSKIARLKALIERGPS